MSTATLQIPIPSEEQMREILLQAAENIARERDHWLTIKEAAAYLRMARRTFDEYRKRWRIPVSEVGKLIYRPDLDRIVAAQLVQPPGPVVIDFPSLELRKEAVPHPSKISA